MLTDVHDAHDCERVAEDVDVLQIPAFLCRQTDLLMAAATNRSSRQREKRAVRRALGHAARRRENSLRPATSAVFLTERGASFGYNNLVVDYALAGGDAEVTRRWCSTAHIPCRCLRRPGRRQRRSAGIYSGVDAGRCCRRRGRNLSRGPRRSGACKVGRRQCARLEAIEAIAGKAAGDSCGDVGYSDELEGATANQTKQQPAQLYFAVAAGWNFE